MLLYMYVLFISFPVGGIILIIVIRLRLYTKQVPLKVHIAFEGVINTIYMTNKYWIVLVFENMVY